MGLLLFPLRAFHNRTAVAGEIIAGAGIYGIVLIATNFLGLREQLIQRWHAHRENGIQIDTIAPATLVESR